MTRFRAECDNGEIVVNNGPMSYRRFKRIVQRNIRYARAYGQHESWKIYCGETLLHECGC